jgi:calcineurin-like phosphoesterase family protein
MSRTWFASDHHVGHGNIIRFVDSNNQLIRPFKDIDEHDEIIIKNHNDLVAPEDRVYFMGDVVMNRKHLEKVGRMNGRKKLIKGNHDIFKIKEYLKYFEDVVAYRIYPDHGLIVSHIPVHPCQLENRFKTNAHGHLHPNLVLQAGSKVPDKRYINLCLEHTNFKPVEFHDLLKRINK